MTVVQQALMGEGVLREVPFLRGDPSPRMPGRDLSLACGSAAVLVVQAHPGHRIAELGLVASLRHEVQMVIGAIEHVEPRA